MLDDARLPERFWGKISPEPNSGCWLWLSGYNGDGYGQLWWKGRVHKSHRVAYETLVGPIPEGLQIDHRCRNRACCNPAHLEPVTQTENVHRGDGGKYNKAKTHCSNGHEFSPENTSARLTSRGTPGRRCKLCTRDRQRRYRAEGNR